tara:strand:+ start:258 stop:1013 length:756 start_codon:yes stop_codon:yes gene_type:complete
VKSFVTNGVEIAYEVIGHGEPILLIHGFASNAHVNWRDTGWVQTLERAGRTVILIDNRGHGRSEKLYDVKDYGAPIMAGDAVALLDHLGLVRVDVMGYSMGARITAFMAISHGSYVGRAIFAGLGINMVKGVGDPEPVALALEATSAEDIADPGARMFRYFAEQTKSDLKALAACMRSSRQKITAEQLAGVEAPVLVAVGTDDAIGGSAAELSALVPGSQVLDIPDRDHMKAVGDKTYKQGVVDFLDQGHA